jgi:hypothetical protein
MANRSDCFARCKSIKPFGSGIPELDRHDESRGVQPILQCQAAGTRSKPSRVCGSRGRRQHGLMLYEPESRGPSALATLPFRSELGWRAQSSTSDGLQGSNVFFRRVRTWSAGSVRWSDRSKMKRKGVPRMRDACLALCFGADEPEDREPEWEWPLLVISDAEPASAERLGGCTATVRRLLAASSSSRPAATRHRSGCARRACVRPGCRPRSGTR